MQLFEMSWRAASAGVNQHCQSVTTASKRAGGGGGVQGELVCKDGGGEAGEFDKFCVFVMCM